MQYLKKDVKLNILDSAAEEFRKFGYKGASIRKVAAGANIASGNSYRYFSNKEELFNSVVEKAFKSVKRLEDVIDGNLKSENGIKAMRREIFRKHLSSEISEIFLRYGDGLYILLDRSGGTKYEGFKQKINDLIYRLLKNGFSDNAKKENPQDEKDFLIHVISASFTEGMRIILLSGHGGDEMKGLIECWMDIMFTGMKNRLESAGNHQGTGE